MRKTKKNKWKHIEGLKWIKREILNQKFFESTTLHDAWRPENFGKALNTSWDGVGRLKAPSQGLKAECKDKIT